eukprot:1069680-Rhodomonas_salina.2
MTRMTWRMVAFGFAASDSHLEGLLGVDDGLLVRGVHRRHHDVDHCTSNRTRKLWAATGPRLRLRVKSAQTSPSPS